MTRDDVIQKLTDKGFVLRHVDVLGYTIVEHRGEQVACVYDTYVCIAKHYPSINPDGVHASYADADKFVIMYSHPISEVDTAIQWLLESPARIDRLKRHKRAETVRRYFDERRSPSLDERRSPSLDERRSPSLDERRSPRQTDLSISTHVGASRHYPTRHCTRGDDE